MSILVSGSIANDYIMNFHDQFGKYILPDKTHELSVNFNINELHAHAWGAWANISYNLWLLWQKSVLLGAIGKEYKASEFMKTRANWEYTVVSESLHTATANIMTDEKNNQITAFYPWALLESGKQSVLDVQGDFSYAIVSPNLPDTMIAHVKQCAERGIPVIFDPGQPLSAFSKEQLLETLGAANHLIVNEYELDLLCKIADIDVSELLNYVESYIVTLGASWSRYISEQETFDVPATPTEWVLDPTGAGDAFRAWILYELHHGNGWRSGMELWSELAHACIQMHGTQRHDFERVQKN